MSVKKTKIAIICGGLDGVLRGYETHTRTLFDVLNREEKVSQAHNLLLFKRDGERKPNEIPLKTPFRYGKICQSLGKIRGDHIYWETFFFGLGFLLYSFFTFQRYEKVLTIEPMVSKTVMFFRFLLWGSPKIIMTHGVTIPPKYMAMMAHEFHQVNIENHQDFASYSKKKQYLVPHFLEDASSGMTKKALRAKHGINYGKVLLSVGSIEPVQKRMDYVMREAAQLKEADWMLMICGSPTYEAVVHRGNVLLGKRFENKLLPRQEMPEAYELADVYVIASLNEGFGLVILEAMRAGLPVIAHDRELFRWILGSDEYCIDLTQEGNLSEFILSKTPEELEAEGLRNRERFFKKFTWRALKEQYLEIILN